jgi:polyphosphate kinase
MKNREEIKEINKQKDYLNREISLLKFHYRVLEEAMDETNPLFERLKFLAIVSSNLDEFFMVRVGSLKEQILANYSKLDGSGLNPQEQLKKISAFTQNIVSEQYTYFNEQLLPALKREKICLCKYDHLLDHEKEYAQNYFLANIYPVLTPLAVDQSRPFPILKNKSLNIGVVLKHGYDENDEEDFFAIVQVPNVLPRLIEIPSDDEVRFVLIEELIIDNLSKLFQGNEIISFAPFRIIRNADIIYDEEDAEDLLEEIERGIKQREKAPTIRLEIDYKEDQRIHGYLKEELDLDDNEIFFIKGPLDLTFLFRLSSLKGYESLKFPYFSPVTPQIFKEDKDIFTIIREKDILLHHPYDSFKPVIQFVQEAAHDPNVLAIKQTLYRVSGDSPIIKALAIAAQKGKQVTVVVEIKARFDEENNIHWAKKLEEAGCHVIYGLVGLKIHCKVTMIVRREDTGIRRYLHLGTGNYNDQTAKVYTDLGIFTCDQYLGLDAANLFNMLSGYSRPDYWHKISAAPLNLRERIVQLIAQEIKSVSEGKKAHIMIKVNSLVDYDIIQHLYKASGAGVKVDLIVRGICCLIPGVQGLSENITVRSIVSKNLEHSRIYYFYNDSFPQVFLSSADLMPRNLDRRVEILFPVEEDALKEKVIQLFKICLEDNAKARIMDAKGSYVKPHLKKGIKIFNSQKYLEKEALKNRKSNRGIENLSFKPLG